LLISQRGRCALIDLFFSHQRLSAVTHFRTDDPHGSLIECQYKEHNDWTTILVTVFLLAAVAAELLLVALIQTPRRPSAFDLAPLRAGHWAFLPAIALIEPSMEGSRTNDLSIAYY
jgi:hypothetical protein